MASRMERLQSTVRSGRRTSTNSCSREVGSGFILPIAPAPHCYSLSYIRVYRYTYPCLHYSSTRLLQLTSCWPPSWAVTVPRLRTAARLSGRIPKFGHVSRYMLDVLHWLPLKQRISYRIISLIWRLLLGLAPAYHRDLCHTTMGIPGRRSLRSTEQGLLLVPFAHTAIMQNRALSVVGPSLWNGLSLALRLFTRIASNSFYAHLKTFLFGRTGIGSAPE